MKRENSGRTVYYRLNVINIVLPPLRERKADLPVLGEHFLRKYNTENGKAVEDISDEVLTAWREYDWPGNVRELENTVERAVVMCKGTTLRIADAQMSNVWIKQQTGISDSRDTGESTDRNYHGRHIG